MTTISIVLLVSGINSLISIFGLIFLSVVLDCVITLIGHIAVFRIIFIVDVGFVLVRDRRISSVLIGVLSLVLCDIVSTILGCSIFVSRPCWLCVVLTLRVILLLVLLLFDLFLWNILN